MECTPSLHTAYLLSASKCAAATGMSEALGGAISHNKVTRFLAQSYFDSRTVWKAGKPLIRQQVPVEDEQKVLIMDDSICEKPHTDENAMICWHYDSSSILHWAARGLPTKTIETQTNHFLAAIVAYIKLETLKFKTGHGHFRLKTMLFAIATQECINTVQKWPA